ncbi:hypothetical protein FI667_g1811, partial [Globisporangium splendens]
MHPHRQVDMAAPATTTTTAVGGGVTALLPKLQHPLVKIRARALASLVFKLREGLVDVQEVDKRATANMLAQRIVVCCDEPELELNALHALELLLEVRNRLGEFNGAVLGLQRASMGKSAELQTAYEKLIERIYVTTPTGHDDKAGDTYNKPPPLQGSADLTRRNGSSEKHEEKAVISKALVVTGPNATTTTTRPRRQEALHSAMSLPELLSSGWRFPPVTLATVDEQFLFEFEVKLKLRTSTEDIVGICQSFRMNLLRNFPVEVFLQRPAIVQYLCYLVQQPFLPSSYNDAGPLSVESKTSAMEKAFQCSFGVNYFDDLGSSSFSFKPSNITTAVFIAALRAIESFLYALLRASKVCLNPVYLVYESAVATDFLNIYDTRRTFYPSAMPDPATSSSSDANGTKTENDQFSLSGAVYNMVMSLLPLLASPHYPRLHVLNVLHLALLLLPERGVEHRSTSVESADKKRIEQILILVCEFCVPVNVEFAEMEWDFSASVLWRIFELVIHVLQCFPPSSYRVAPRDSSGPDQTKQIAVPERIWRFVKMCVAHSTFGRFVENPEWRLETLVAYLAEIDSSMSTFVETNRMVESTRNEVAAFITCSKQLAGALDGNHFSVDEVPSTLNLDTAFKVALAVDELKDADARIAVYGILLAFAAAIAKHKETSRFDMLENECMRAISIHLMSVGGEKGKSQKHVSSYFSSQLARFMSGEISSIDAEARRSFVVDSLCHPEFLGALFLSIASCGTNDLEALWSIMVVILSELVAAPKHDLSSATGPVIPFLQHFAFMEPAADSPAQLRATQPQLVEVINQAEKSASASERLLLIARCLLHKSSYLRKAATSGLLSVLSEVDPLSFRRLADTMCEDVLEDPFEFSAREGNSLTSFEKKLMERALPPLPSPNDVQKRQVDISSSLAKLSALRKVLTGSSASITDIKETALNELMLLVDNMAAVPFSLLEELGEVAKLKDLCIELMQLAVKDRHSDGNERFLETVLVLLRDLLWRSLHLRNDVRSDTTTVGMLVSHIFDSSVAVRAQMYYIVLLLTLSYENFALSLDHGASSMLPRSQFDVDSIPEMVKDTFGIHSSRWSQCNVNTCRMEILWQEVCAANRQQKTASRQAPVPQMFSLNGDVESTTENSNADTLPEFTFVIQKLQAAKSHTRFLNALFHLMEHTEATEAARQWMISNWEHTFDRYIGVSPQSERDEIILGSILSCLNSLIMDMERQSQLQLLLVVKRSFIPLLKGTQSMGLSSQVLRILLHLSSSEVSDLFLSLAFDTDLLDVLCHKYSSLYATHPTLHALMLELILRIVSSIAKQRDDTEQLYLDSIYERLHSLVPPLLAIACRHRVPGSFIERDVFAMASQALVGIIAIIPRDRLIGGSTSALSSDSSLLVDNSWSSRLLFDHSSQLRQLGFRLLATSLTSVPQDAESRLVQLAIETSMDETECDAVRGAACSVLYKALLRFEVSSELQQDQLIAILGHKSLAKNVLHALSNICKDDKLLVNCGLSLTRLLRLLFTKRDVFAAHFGDVEEELATADREYDVHHVLIQMLSFRTWEDSFVRYCHRYLRCVDPVGSMAWTSSILPIVLQMMVEVLKLFDTIFQHSSSGIIEYFIKVTPCALTALVVDLLHTTFQYQLAELIEDTEKSLSQSLASSTHGNEAASLKRFHYDTLEMCAIGMCSLTGRAASISQWPNPLTSAPESTSSTWIRGNAIAVIAKLMELEHPVQFRASFCRILIVALVHPSGRSMISSSENSVRMSLCSNVFDVYKETVEFRPSYSSMVVSDASVVSLPSIRRIATALKVLLESSSALRQLVIVKQGLHFGVTAIKELFHAIRMEGGFGGRSKHPREEYLTTLCTRIAIHFDILASLLGGEVDAQKRAMCERVQELLVANWTTMRMALHRGSSVFFSMPLPAAS